MSTQTVIRSFEAKVDDVVEKERAVIARIGGRAVDRHRSIIDPSGIDISQYNKNRIVLWEHGRDPHRGMLPVGRNKWIKVDGDKLIAKTLFRNDAYSEDLFQAYASEDLKGWSINVLAHEASSPTREEMRSSPELESGCDIIYRRTELVEYSAVAIPSHRDALTMIVARGIWVPDEAREMARTLTSRTSVSIPAEVRGTAIVPGVGPVLTEDGPDDEDGDDNEDEPEPETPRKQLLDLETIDKLAGRAMTDSIGGMAGGGAAVKPAREGEGDDDEDGEDEETRAECKTGPTPVPKSAPIGEARRVRKKGGKWYLFSQDGTKRLGGPYGSREEAEHREQQVEYFKHEDAEGRSSLDGRVPDPPGKPHDPSTFRIEPRGDHWHIVDDRGNDRGAYPSEDEARENLDVRCKMHRESGDGGDGYRPAGRSGPDDLIRHDGHGGWTARGLDGVTFRDRRTAEDALRLLASPPRFGADLEWIRGEIRRRDEQLMADIAGEFELRRFGRV